MALIGFISLGCAKNQVDCERMMYRVKDAGYDVSGGVEGCDVVVINTCGFIDSAKSEAIENILTMGALKAEGRIGKILVTGCLSQRYQDQILEEMPEVDGVLGTGSYTEIVPAIEKLLQDEGVSEFGDIDAPEVECGRIVTTPEHYAFIKIAEGCDNRCSYCAIPSIRGKFRSRPMEDLIAEAKQLESLGIKELTVVAQDITRYGLDLYGKYSLAELLHKITEETSIPWIRLLYCYPDKITDELIAEIRDNPRILPYLDMPLQHISDRMLTAMNRHGDGKMIRQVLAKLRREIPDIVIRTTFIVGFPGENEEDFEELCAFVKEQRFDHAGVFPYSREEDTPAYDLPDQIDEQIKQDRMDHLMRLQMEINEELNREKVGRIVDVLCEDYDPVAEVHFGRSAADAPEIDGKVYFRADTRVAPGSMVKVKVRRVVDYDLYGNLVTR